MDDRRVRRTPVELRIVRGNEFTRLGKSLLASAYERVVPIARIAVPASNSACSIAGSHRKAVRKEVA